LPAPIQDRPHKALSGFEKMDEYARKPA